MKINQIIVETSTTTGSVATISKTLGATQTRPDIRGLKPVQQLGGKTKGPYANSLTEGAMKQLSMDLKELKDEEFKKKYKMTKQEARKELSAKPEPVKEAKLDEEDIILIPGHGRVRKSGLVPHGKSRVDHEVEMARSDILATMKNAKALYELLKNRSEEEGLEGWVQEKLIKANDYLNSVKEYYDEKMMQEMTGGVIAGGLAYESMNEGAKVDSLVTDALRIMKGSELTDAVRALKTVLGDRAYNERRGFYNFYVRQIADMYSQQGVAEGEGNKYGSQENWDSLRKDIRSQYPYKKGTTVTVPHKGKLVNGKIVRYDAGGGGYSPAYVVDIGEYESIMVPPNKVRQGVAEGLNEFAPVGGDDREPDEEEILRQLAAKWWLGTEQEMSKAQKTLAAMGWDIGQDESGDDDAGVFVIRVGDENGDSYIAFNHSDLEELNEAYNKYHANRTGFSRGQRDDERHDLDTPTQLWGLKINGKVWSKDGKDVTFTSKEAALNTRNAILKNRPDLEIGLVTKGGVAEEKQRLDPSCWKGYKKQGTKMKGDTRVNNCVPVKESSILAGIKKV